ncbi:MAG: ECF transporter S component [Clostridiales bacterium]|jgi:niacin transporter|nr:ECF transporter S component [Clostridiales bacterium]
MKIKTKDIAVTALLTAIAILIPLVVPVKVLIPPFSATLASHVPLIIAMFINPFAAIFTALGSALGFFFALGPVVAARAAMHVFFVAAGAYMIKKRCNFFLTVFATMIIHALSEMLIVYLLFAFFGQSKIIGSNTMMYVQSVIAAGTSVHHLVDYFIAMMICVPLSRQSGGMIAPVSLTFKKTTAGK